jgi:protein-S-isoprenylcysteine O-methyltransferase Ste14
MHYLAGVLLIIQYGLACFPEKMILIKGLDYIAWGIWVVAAVLLFLPIIYLRRKGRVQKGSSYVATEVLVDTGIYAIVRHPQYLGWMLMYLVIFLFNPRWEIAVVGTIGVACMYVITKQEEELLIKKFGKSYLVYVQDVPRINILAGIVRSLRRRRDKYKSG